MDARLQELVDYTKEKLGLGNYYLEEYYLRRHVSSTLKTVYTLEMEWFPKHIIARTEDDEVPDGTASVSIFIDSKKLKNIMFIGGKSFLEKPLLENRDKQTTIHWIEQETGMSFKEDFILWKKEERSLSFTKAINGVEVHPREWVELEFDEAGELVTYWMYGDLTEKTSASKENYTLNLQNAEPYIRKHFGLWDFPIDELEQLIRAYTIEEVYIRNDLSGTLPLELIQNTQDVDYILRWDEPIHKPFKRKPVKLQEELKPEQAYICEPHPETLQLKNEDVQECVKEVRCFLQRVYPNDSGKWKMTNIHRNYDYIDVKLEQLQKSRSIYNRKLLIMLDSSSFKAFNYMDNEPMFERFKEYKMPGETKISQEAAYEAVKKHFILKPRYVYDKENGEYVLCGFLDCHHYVDAETGKVGLLNDL